MPISREQAIRKADVAIETIKEDYHPRLLEGAAAFLAAVQKNDMNSAMALAHNIASEAATFDWVAVSVTAEKVRDIIEADSFEKKQQLVLLGAQSILLLAKANMKAQSEKTQLLLQEFDKAFDSAFASRAA